MPEIDFLKTGTPEADSFPAVGHTYEADLGGDILVQFEYHSVNSMTIYGLKGEHKGFTETVEISVMSIRPGVFMVGWQENNQTTVTHIEDFEKGILYSNMTLPGNKSLRLQGYFKQVK
nr:hypothetical protein [uncultured Caproiciproducens sp.]